MKVLIVGSGGREHALAWKVAQSPLVNQLFVAPGNAGTALEPKTRNVPIDATDILALHAFALKNKIDLTIVGPEAPLVLGITDMFTQSKLNCFGPTRQAAQLEGSKAFCKAFLKRHQIPTAAYEVFQQAAPAKAYIQTQTLPIVIKASGLASGKGVVIAQTQAEAFDAVDAFITQHEVIIEAFLTGEEVSFIAMVDGTHIQPLATSQDHKRRDTGDLGPNTGGMGAYSPAPIVDQALEAAILEKVMKPTVLGMQAEGTPFVGFLYAGLMIGPQGEITVLEFNCRLGDPEAQPLLMRLESDLVPLCLQALKGVLNQSRILWDPRSALGVVMASGGYPGDYQSGFPISGLESTLPHTKVFHSGTAHQNERCITRGGRVLCVTALGDTLAEAQQRAYAQTQKIQFRHAFYRTDIGWRGIKGR